VLQAGFTARANHNLTARMKNQTANPRPAEEPLDTKTQEYCAPESNLAPTPRPVQVLLAEDNPVNRVVMLRMLDALGCRTDTVDDGLAALVAVEHRHYDLVLMDIQMPVMDGLVAARHIRALPCARSLRVIAMTAGMDDDERKACIDAGMEPLLAKPVRKDPLEAIVLAVAEGLRDGSGRKTAEGFRFEHLDHRELAGLVNDLGTDAARVIVAAMAVEAASAGRAAGNPGALTDANRLSHSLRTLKALCALAGAHPLAADVEVLHQACSGHSSPSDDGKNGFELQVRSVGERCEQLAEELQRWQAQT